MKAKGNTKKILAVIMGGTLLLGSSLSLAGGNMFPVRANGTVVINLTDAMEMFSLTETGPGEYDYSYTIDMMVSTGTLTGVTSHVTIKGLKGNNKITVMGSFPKNLTIIGGKDDDTVTLIGAEVGGKLVINLLAGDNVVDAVGLMVADDTTVTTAGGADQVTMSSLTSSDRLTIKTGAGDDAVALMEVVELKGATAINTHLGEDTLTVDGAIVNGRFSATMGKQNDTIIITDSEFASFTSINAGNQDDDVTVTGSTFEKYVGIKGASGTRDVYRDDETNTFEAASVNSGFEFFLLPGNQPDRIVFLSSSLHTGNLGGLAGADAICQTLSEGPNSIARPGTYKAWLSGAGMSAASRLEQSTVPYTLVDGSVVANDWTDLTDRNIAHPIDTDEDGTMLPAREVWTASSSNGNAGFGDCSDWTRANNSPPFASVGLSNATNSNWSSVYTQFCDRPNVGLYCIEQGN